MTKFKQKGILVSYGGHGQYVLPIGNWDAKRVSFKEVPTDLPAMPISKWVLTDDPIPQKPKGSDYVIVDGKAVLRSVAQIQVQNQML